MWLLNSISGHQRASKFPSTGCEESFVDGSATLGTWFRNWRPALSKSMCALSNCDRNHLLWSVSYHVNPFTGSRRARPNWHWRQRSPNVKAKIKQVASKNKRPKWRFIFRNTILSIVLILERWNHAGVFSAVPWLFFIICKIPFCRTPPPTKKKKLKKNENSPQNPDNRKIFLRI